MSKPFLCNLKIGKLNKHYDGGYGELIEATWVK